MFRKKWDKKAIFGLVLLGFSYLLGALLKNAAQIASISDPPGFRGACDTYVRSFCIPTFYLSLHLDAGVWLVLNATSLIVSVAFFVLGVLFLRD